MSKEAEEILKERGRKRELFAFLIGIATSTLLWVILDLILR